MESKYDLTDVTLKEITPKAYLCKLGICPAIYKGIRETTPKEMQCAVNICPSTHKAEKNGKEVYLIIGKIINPKDAGLEKKVGKDEGLIEIPKGLIDNMEK